HREASSAGSGPNAVPSSGASDEGAQRAMSDEPAREESSRRVFGEPHLTYRVGEFAYRVSPTAFFQSARFLLPEMVAAVTGEQSGTVAIDLYAGVGLFT